MVIGENSNKVARTASSLDEQLKRQLKYLDNSSLIYDQGDHEEAIRLAVTLRVLLHDTTNSTSLLRHLGIKDKLDFVDTGITPARLEIAMTAWRDPQHPELRIASISPSDAGLLNIARNGDGTFGYVPTLGAPRFHPKAWQNAAAISSQKFKPWWTEGLVQDSNLKSFSRKNLVLIMANQDGGAHVDHQLDTDYTNLCNDDLGNQMVEYYTEAGAEPLYDISSPDLQLPSVRNNVAYASVRQIAYEVALTLHRYLGNVQ
jgi:hypothetical protein